MCSHPEHRVEVLPDGQIDETHVMSLEELQDRINRLVEDMVLVSYGGGFRQEYFYKEVVEDGKPWTDAEGE